MKVLIVHTGNGMSGFYGASFKEVKTSSKSLKKFVFDYYKGILAEDDELDDEDREDLLAQAKEYSYDEGGFLEHKGHRSASLNFEGEDVYIFIVKEK